jgi:predicted O-methyltransferase YrrM
MMHRAKNKQEPPMCEMPKNCEPDILTESLPDYSKLFDFAYGIARWQTLEVGIDLKIFDRLAQPVSAVDLARLLNFHPANTERFLDGLAALELLTKHQGKYRNTPMSETFLVTGRPTYLGDFLRYQITGVTVPNETLIKMIQSGPAEAQLVQDDSSSSNEDIAHHYANYLRAGMSKLYVDILGDIKELDRPKKILDLGGGPGITSIAFAMKYPAAQVVLFEQPSEVKIAREIIDQYRFGGRVSAMAGDFINDSIGDGYDLIFAGFTLNYARFELDKMLSKIQAAMNPGGIFVCAGDGLTHERTAPSDFVISMLPWSMAGQDMGFDKGEAAEAMRRASFNVLRSFTVESSSGEMNIDIAQKPKK